MAVGALTSAVQRKEQGSILNVDFRLDVFSINRRAAFFQTVAKALYANVVT